MVTNMIVVSVLLSTNNRVVRGEEIAPGIALTKSVIINERTGKHRLYIWSFFCITHSL